jgi:hypothetical protein
VLASAARVIAQCRTGPLLLLSPLLARGARWNAGGLTPAQRPAAAAPSCCCCCCHDPRLGGVADAATLHAVAAASAGVTAAATAGAGAALAASAPAAAPAASPAPCTFACSLACAAAGKLLLLLSSYARFSYTDTGLGWPAAASAAAAAPAAAAAAASSALWRCRRRSACTEAVSDTRPLALLLPDTADAPSSSGASLPASSASAPDASADAASAPATAAAAAPVPPRRRRVRPCRGGVSNSVLSKTALSRTDQAAVLAPPSVSHSSAVIERAPRERADSGPPAAASAASEGGSGRRLGVVVSLLMLALLALPSALLALALRLVLRRPVRARCQGAGSSLGCSSGSHGCCCCCCCCTAVAEAPPASAAAAPSKAPNSCAGTPPDAAAAAVTAAPGSSPARRMRHTRSLALLVDS